MEERSRAKKSVSVKVFDICRASTPADGGKKRNSIILGERGIPGGKLLIAGSHKGSAECSEFGKANGIAVEEIRERGTVSHLHGFFRQSGKFTDAAEKKNVDAKIVQGGSHQKIVT
jgi:hypothetical protein